MIWMVIIVQLSQSLYISKGSVHIWVYIRSKWVGSSTLNLWYIHKSALSEPVTSTIMRVIIQAECQNYYQRTFSELQSFCFLLNKQCSTQKMANKDQVNLIQCEGTEISRVIYLLGILMASEMNYTHPQKRLMIIKPFQHFLHKSFANCSKATLETKPGEKWLVSARLETQGNKSYHLGK